jgi:tetratricopeptide (TPR) repeat protein
MKHSSKKSFGFLAAGTSLIVMIGLGSHIMQSNAGTVSDVQTLVNIDPAAGSVAPGFAGDFLASYHAQSQYDWKSANEFLERVLAQDPDNPELIRRSMVLAMGAGQMDIASTRARKLASLIPNDPTNALGVMILTVDDISKNRLPEALTQIDKMPAGDMADFIRPIIRSWILAGQGKFDVTGFNPTTVHLYHASLISIMLEKPASAREFADKIAGTEGLSPMESERTADIYAAIGDREKALTIYKQLVAERPNEALEEKITAVSNKDSDLSTTLRPLMVKTAAQGVALAMFDMANILYNDQTDSSTKLFAQMAIALDPNLIDARLLLADSLARNGRLDEAISYFRDIPETHKAYLPAQRYAADLLAEAGQTEQARVILSDLFTQYNDVEALIRIGDLYRSEEKYKDALTWYNKAVNHLGNKVPEDYWHLLYARGMAYERQGEWGKAETDLKAALTYRPDHPYLLNYLGYGWADQGMHLKEALKMIERAVALRPSDGYITDSLGWVHFMMGDYKESIPYLERAVELLPYDATINDHLGDAYWYVGRRQEAKFQWERAINHAETDKIKVQIQAKLDNGLPPRTPVREAVHEEKK